MTEEVAVMGGPAIRVLHVQNIPKLSAVHRTTQLPAQAKHPDVSRVLGKRTCIASSMYCTGQALLPIESIFFGRGSFRVIYI